MLIELSRASLLSDVVGIISELVNEVRINFRKEGAEIVAIDPANVAMVILRMPPSLFTRYEVNEEESIAVNLDDFKQVLRRGRQSLTMELKENRLYLDFKGEKKKSFVLSLIDIEAEEK
ncbi:MAG: hypothetical protein AABX59_01155, partial [Nanoarchaeota archaeon]